MKIRLKEGRLFDENMSTDIFESVIVNETFVDEMGWDQAIDKKIKFNNREYNIIGVVEDFHYNYFYSYIRPVVFRLTESENFNYIVAKVKEGKTAQTNEFLQAAWSRLIPLEPYSAFYQAEVFDFNLYEEERMGELFGIFAFIALIISCMGLFGLVSINIAKRKKEIGIRKALGADIRNIFILLNRPYFIMLLISTILAAPVSYLLVKSAMDSVHQYHIEISVIHFIITLGVILLTALLSAFMFVLKAARSNPVDSLRYE
jgi:putative ABC transport system permease protein